MKRAEITPGRVKIKRCARELSSSVNKEIEARAAAGFAGLSERNTLRVTNNEAKYRIHNVKFTNRATPRSVTAKTVQGQHQIDLMDLNKEAVNHLQPLCKQLKIKLIKSRPYHPQSLGKAEESHRRLRKKIMYDLVSLDKKGVNWAENLEDYNRILNEECKKELCWRSPFEIYYGRKSNQLVKPSLNCVDSDESIVTTAPKNGN